MDKVLILDLLATFFVHNIQHRIRSAPPSGYQHIDKQAGRTYFAPLFPLPHPPFSLLPATTEAEAVDPLAVLPELAVLGLLALGLPAAGGLVGLEGVDLAVLELEVGAGDAGALHDAGGALVPDGAEEVEADGAQAELVAEALEAEAVARAVQLTQLRDVEGRAVARLLEQEYRQPVVGGALLREGG